MTRTLRMAVGLTILALAPVWAAAQVPGSLDDIARAGRFTHGGAVTLAALLTGGERDCDSNARGQHSKVRISEPSSKESAITGITGITGACRTGNAAHTDIKKRDWPRVAAWGNARAALRQAVREQVPAAATRALRPSLQGGLLALGGDGWGNAGGFFGAGVTATPFPNLALSGDGHLVAGMEGAGAAVYGSGTVALRGIIPSTSAEKVAGVAGIGLGLFAGGGYVAAGPQLVFGLEGEAGFGQIRVLRFPDGIGSFVLLGGFRF